MLPDSKKNFPIIDLGDFCLREKRDSDAQDFFNYYSDSEVNKYILCDIPQNLEEARRELNYWRNVFYQNDGIYFAISEKKSDRLIGSIGLTSFNSYQARTEISYDLDKRYWRCGIMTKAINALVNYAFEDFAGKINRIEAFVSTANLPSKNLLLKCGFQIEGILRQHRQHNGSFVDVFLFSILKQDFERLKESS